MSAQVETPRRKGHVVCGGFLAQLLGTAGRDDRDPPVRGQPKPSLRNRATLAVLLPGDILAGHGTRLSTLT